jgi:steroid delta-isomerase-like uncharacterized protein
MSLDPHTLMHRWFEEVWNQGRVETIDELMAIDGIGHGLGEGGAVVRGPAAFKPFARNLRSAFPDIHIHIKDTIVQGDKAVVRIVVEGTHLGPGIGLAPTNHRISVAGIVIVRVSNGQIKEAWNTWDQLGMLQQLGAIPGPEGRDDRFLTAQE